MTLPPFQCIRSRGAEFLLFGNWRGPTKYADLAAIMPRAESCHARAHFPAAGVMHTADYRRSLELTRAAGFRGPYTLIYDGPGADEWAGLAAEVGEVFPFLEGERLTR